MITGTLLEIWVRDPGSEIWDPENAIPDPDPGFKKHQILDRSSNYYAILFP